jgi:predicted transcriptional regulator of viral defense system
MKAVLAIKALSEVTAWQWGLVTVSQAQLVGVSRLNLSRLSAAGLLKRIRQGVYLDCSVPDSWLTPLRAQWLSFKPDTLAFQRLEVIHTELVVGSRTACWVWGVGDFNELPYTFYSTSRIKREIDGVKTVTIKLEPSDITIVDGLPVTTQTRTIIDLMREGFDLGGVGQVINEFGYENINFERLRTSAQSLKTPYGLTKTGFIAQIEDFEAKARTVRLQSLGLIDLN